MQTSLSQLTSMLWSSPQVRVFAVMSGHALPDITTLLQKADVAGWQCLLPGAVPAEQAAQAPYLAELKADSEFTQWLLGEAAKSYPHWGVVGVGPINLLRMREHARRLAKVTLPDGGTRGFTWYDPQLWAALLPKLDGDQLMRVYDDLTDWVTITPAEWQWHTLNAGRLVQVNRACAAT